MNPSNEEATQIKKELIEVKRKLDVKRYQYNKTKFTRYIYNHKGRTLIIILCFIILCICVFTQYPIDGSINTENFVSKLMSLLGYIASSVFVALSLSVLAVETYLSREELNKIDEELTNELNKNITKNAGNPSFLSQVSEFINKLVKKRTSKRKGPGQSSVVHVVNTSVNASSEVTGINIEDLKEKIYYLSSDEKYKVFNKMEDIINPPKTPQESETSPNSNSLRSKTEDSTASTV